VLLAMLPGRTSGSSVEPRLVRTALQAVLVAGLAAAAAVALVRRDLLPAALLHSAGALAVWVWLLEPAVRRAGGAPPARRWQDVRLVCRPCGRDYPPGAWRCPKCRRSLRPRLLNALIWAGLGLAPARVAAMPALGMTSSVDWALAGLILAGVPMLVGLRYGRYWAWAGVQVLWTLGLVLSFGRAAEQSLADPRLMAEAAVQAGLVGVLWFYVTRPQVAGFCSIGREGPAQVR
jgi:hypothetical protein